MYTFYNFSKLLIIFLITTSTFAQTFVDDLYFSDSEVDYSFLHESTNILINDEIFNIPKEEDL